MRKTLETQRIQGAFYVVRQLTPNMNRVAVTADGFSLTAYLS
jgi:hypothetical protein